MIHGEKMREGQPVLLLYPSANREEREFASPDAFDVRRRAPRILTFGAGTHGCLGLHVAKMEGKVADHLRAALTLGVDFDSESRCARQRAPAST